LRTVSWIETFVQALDEELDFSETNVCNLLEGRGFLALKLAVDGLSAVREGVGNQCQFPEGDGLSVISY
jgi:hypothetical protein